MKCFECGTGTIERRTIHVSKELRGVELSFPARVNVCDGCGEWEIPLEEASTFGAALDAAYRRKLGLLSPAEIRESRELLNMSQRQFAAYIGVGPASIKRWELGALQDKSSDEVIRLKTHPDYARRNLEQVCKLARVEADLEPAQAPGQQSVFIEASRIPRRPVLHWDDIVITRS